MPSYPGSANWDSASTATYNRVVSYCRHIAGTAGFGTATRPTQSEVYSFLDDAYYEIGGLLEVSGYAITQTDPEVCGILNSLQAIVGAIKVELTTPNTGLGNDKNDRWLAFKDSRDRLEALIKGNALTNLGATSHVRVGAYIAATGTSRSRKRVLTDNTDAMKPRFPRGFGQSPYIDNASRSDLAIEPGRE